MPYSTIVKTRRDGTLTLADNGAANSLTVAYEEGNLTINLPQESVQLFLDRGQIGSPPAIRYGDDQPITWTFNAYLRDLSDAAYATLEEILMRAGLVATAWVSTMGATGEVFTLTLTWLIEGTNHGDAADHSISLPYSYVTGSMSEGYPNSISLSGTSYAVRPTIVS